MPPKLDAESDTKRVNINASKSLLARIDEWRRAQDAIPNISAAIRRLVEIGLDSEARKKKPRD